MKPATVVIALTAAAAVVWYWLYMGQRVNTTSVAPVNSGASVTPTGMIPVNGWPSPTTGLYDQPLSPGFDSLSLDKSKLA